MVFYPSRVWVCLLYPLVLSNRLSLWSSYHPKGWPMRVVQLLFCFSRVIKGVYMSFSNAFLQSKIMTTDRVCSLSVKKKHDLLHIANVRKATEYRLEQQRVLKLVMLYIPREETFQTNVLVDYVFFLYLCLEIKVNI